MEALVRRVDKTDLVVNLAKCKFVKARVQYLEYVAWHGKASAAEGKIMNNFEPLHYRCAPLRFLGMIRYYKRFIRCYSSVFAPLTVLLRKDRK